MNKLMHLIEQKKKETIEETIPEIIKLQDETKRLMKLVKKDRSLDSNMLDIHSLIKLATEQVERLTQDDEIETVDEILPEVVRLEDETKALIKLITKDRSLDSNMLDIHSLIKIEKEKVRQLIDD